jgi:hypothetical protein
LFFSAKVSGDMSLTARLPKYILLVLFYIKAEFKSGEAYLDGPTNGLASVSLPTQYLNILPSRYIVLELCRFDSKVSKFVKQDVTLAPHYGLKEELLIFS